MELLIWFFVLMLQAAAFTWVSRARNSGSLAYHAVASIFSNGIWFVSQIFIIGFIAKPDTPIAQLLLYMSVYVLGTTLGATVMHFISMRYLESGKRKVGA